MHACLICDSTYHHSDAIKVVLAFIYHFVPINKAFFLVDDIDKLVVHARIQRGGGQGSGSPGKSQSRQASILMFGHHRPASETPLGHHRPASETPFQWRFADEPIKWRFACGPMMARFLWYLDPLSPSTKNKNVVRVALRPLKKTFWIRISSTAVDDFS